MVTQAQVRAPQSALPVKFAPQAQKPTAQTGAFLYERGSLSRSSAASVSAFEITVRIRNPLTKKEPKALTSILRTAELLAKTEGCVGLLGGNYKNTPPHVLYEGVFALHFNAFSVRYYENSQELTIHASNPLANDFSKKLAKELKSSQIYTWLAHLHNKLKSF